MNKKFISWRRVSTFKQGRSGLGLEAQKEIIRYFVERAEGELIADYEECYTGKELSGCKELRKAMNHAKKENATLIIAKSDRFRNTAEALQIYEEMGDGNIMFCDLPTCDKFSLTLFFALAEREALLVSIRTKQALAVKKAHGAKLGGANEKYQMNYNKKTYKERHEDGMKRGMMKNARYVASRDVQAFLRILKMVFPEPCSPENPKEWDWKRINTKRDNKTRIIGLMVDYKALDDGGALFRKWDFANWDEHYTMTRLCSHINNVRKAILNHNNEEVEE